MKDLIILCDPAQFAFNKAAADSNYFMQANVRPEHTSVCLEFENFVRQLDAAGIQYKILPNPGDENDTTPDAVFVNNWFAYMPNRQLFLFPMAVPNRSLERRNQPALLQALQETGFEVKEIVDLSQFEKDRQFLEGTGSLVFDHRHKLAYAALSERTHEAVMGDFCQKSGYTPVLFKAYDAQQRLIYHTNVMLSIMMHVVVVGSETIEDTAERDEVLKHLQSSGREVIDISQEQVESFCANVIDIKNGDDEYLMLSEAAFKAFKPNQLATLQKYYQLVVAPIPTIEAVGGGSLRCMIGKVGLV